MSPSTCLQGRHMSPGACHLQHVLWKRHMPASPRGPPRGLLHVAPSETTSQEVLSILPGREERKLLREKFLQKRTFSSEKPALPGPTEINPFDQKWSKLIKNGQNDQNGRF